MKQLPERKEKEAYCFQALYYVYAVVVVVDMDMYC